MKLGAAFIVAVASLAMSSEAAAEIFILQNDGFVDDASVGFQEGFASGESGAVTLGPVEGPFQVRKVQLLFGPSGGATTVGVSIYADDGSDEPGDLLTQLEVDLQPAADALSEIDLTGAGIELDGGSVRISIAFSHTGAPSIARDDDGTIQSGRNWIFSGGWADSEDFGLEGDWIIRAEVDARDGGTTASSAASTGAGGAGGDDSGASSGTGPTATATTTVGGASTAGGASVCVPGETQPCVGADACDGGQSCLADGSGWSACDCGAGDDGDGDPAAADDGGCGCVAPGGAPHEGALGVALVALAAALSRRRAGRRGDGPVAP